MFKTYNSQLQNFRFRTTKEMMEEYSLPESTENLGDLNATTVYCEGWFYVKTDYEQTVFQAYRGPNKRIHAKQVFQRFAPKETMIIQQEAVKIYAEVMLNMDIDCLVLPQNRFFAGSDMYTTVVSYKNQLFSWDGVIDIHKKLQRIKNEIRKNEQNQQNEQNQPKSRNPKDILKEFNNSGTKYFAISELVTNNAPDDSSETWTYKHW